MCGLIVPDFGEALRFGIQQEQGHSGEENALKKMCQFPGVRGWKRMG